MQSARQRAEAIAILDGIALALNHDVMPGLVPGIRVFGISGKTDVDGRDKPGHDGGGSETLSFGGSLVTDRNHRPPRAISAISAAAITLPAMLTRIGSV